ncbi:MAG: trans-2-enoyl-CoA reductase family protein [Clostridia bacterium]|nr:trans-2-enoyl-CoA reductase family protein [Clostridia bacterium]
MKIEPKIRGFICTTAHPDGCRENVRRQIAYVKSQPKTDGPKRVLVIGASTGYGLASRISAAFSCDAATLGIVFEKPSVRGRNASAGWYNTAAFEEFAQADGLYAKTINGDAFSEEIKQKTINMIRQDLGTVDMVVYSVATSRRTAPDGTAYSSVLKTTGGTYSNKTIDLTTRTISDVTIEPAAPEEVEATVKVMGGEDWEAWMHALKNAGVLAEHTVTVAYSYIGPKLTHPIYLNGSIGKAKQDLYETSQRLSREIDGVDAYISVNKALVTQSSAAIPIVPLYITILYKIMKEKGLHEGCIEQMYRMFHDKLYAGQPALDQQGQLRLDDYEMQEDVQQAVMQAWTTLSEDNLAQIADIDGYWEDFYHMFGFNVSGVDYDADTDVEVSIASIQE